MVRRATGGLVHVRQVYGVPAYRGRRIRFTGSDAPIEGVILSAVDLKLWVRVTQDGVSRRFGPLHPSWEVTYL